MAGRHLFDSEERRLPIVQAVRLEPVERLPLPKVLCEQTVGQHVATNRVDTEEGRSAPACLEADERRPGRLIDRQIDEPGEVRDRHPIDKGRKWQTLAKVLLDLGNDAGSQ